MVMSFIRSMPKTKDLVAGADFMDFIKLANEDSATLLRKIAADKAEVEELHAQASSKWNTADALMTEAEDLKAKYETAFDALETAKVDFETATKTTKDQLALEKEELDARDVIITNKQAELNAAITTYQKDRDNLDKTIAGFEEDKDKAVAAANVRETAAAAAEDKFNRKYASITNAAAD